MRERKTARAAQFKTLEVPALAIRGPFFYAIAAVSALVIIGLLLLRHVPLDNVTVLGAQVLLPKNEIVIRSPRAGRLAQIYVSNGEQVKAGQLLARLDTSALAAQIKNLSGLMQSARIQLADIRATIKKELLAPYQSPQRAQGLMVDLAARLKKVAHHRQFLYTQIAAAEREVTRAEIYSDVTGRIELIQGLETNNIVTPNTALMKIFDEVDGLRVRSVLRGDLEAGLHANGRVKVVLYDANGRAQGPFEARLHSSRLVAGGSSFSHQTHGELIYNLVQPRSQIAKKIALQSGMRASVLIETGQAKVFSQVFAPKS